MTLSARNWAWDLTHVPGDDGRPGRQLTAGEKVTLLALAEHESAVEGFAYPSIDTLSKRTCQSVRTVNTHLKTLQDLRLVRVRKRTKTAAGKWPQNIYFLDVDEDYREPDKEWQRNH